MAGFVFGHQAPASRLHIPGGFFFMVWTPGFTLAGIQDLQSFSNICLVANPCPTLCNSMDYSQPGSSIQGISQVRILECIAISFFTQTSEQSPKIGENL